MTKTPISPQEMCEQLEEALKRGFKRFQEAEAIDKAAGLSVREKELVREDRHVDAILDVLPTLVENARADGRSYVVILRPSRRELGALPEVARRVLDFCSNMPGWAIKVHEKFEDPPGVHSLCLVLHW